MMTEPGKTVNECLDDAGMGSLQFCVGDEAWELPYFWFLATVMVLFVAYLWVPPFRRLVHRCFPPLARLWREPDSN